MNTLVLSTCMLLGAVPSDVSQSVVVELASLDGKWSSPLAANPLFQAAIRSLQAHTEQVGGRSMVVVEACSRVSTEFPLTLGTDWFGDQICLPFLAPADGEVYTNFPRKSYISTLAPAGTVMTQEELKGLG